MAKGGSLYKQKNSKFWWIKYYLPGNPNPIRESTKTEDADEAQRFLWRRLGEVATGKFAGLEPERIRVNTLLDMVVEDYTNNDRASVSHLKSRLKNRLRPFFGNLRAAAIGTRQISSYVAKRKKEKAANGSINRELAIMRKAYNIGFKAQPQLVARPLNIPILEENNVRDGVVSHEDYMKLRQFLPEPYRTFMVCAYHLGTRRGELSKIEWSEVDLAAKQITLKRYTTKTKEPRVLPIYGDMGGYLEMLKAQHNLLYPGVPQVFHKKGRPFTFSNKIWNRYVKKLGLPRYLFHDFRRTAISNMIEAGFSEKEVMTISGHKTDAVFRRYQIIRKQRIQVLGAKMEEFYKAQEATGHSAGHSTPDKTLLN